MDPQPPTAKGCCAVLRASGTRDLSAEPAPRFIILKGMFLPLCSGDVSPVLIEAQLLSNHMHHEKRFSLLDLLWPRRE